MFSDIVPYYKILQYDEILVYVSYFNSCNLHSISIPSPSLNNQVLQADPPGPLSASGKLAALLLTNRILADLTVR